MRCSIDCPKESVGTITVTTYLPSPQRRGDDTRRSIVHNIPIGFCADHAELLDIDIDALDEVMT